MNELNGNQPSVDDAAIDELFGSMGVTPGETPEVKKQKTDAQIQRMQQLHQEQQALAAEYKRANETSQVIGAAKEGVEAAAGIGIAIGDILTNTYNGIVGLADSAENYAATKGIGSGDLLSEANKVSNPLAMDEEGNALDLNMGAKVTRAVTNFAGPMLATVASGGGFVAGAGVNAAYNFLAIDPESERLSDHLKGTVVEDVPVAAQLVDFLQTKPTDSEMQSRFKNLMEGATIDVAVGGMLWGASRAYAGISKLRSSKFADQVTTEINAGKDSLKAAADQATATPVTPSESAMLNASDEAISPPTQAGDGAGAPPPGPDVNEESFKEFKQNYPSLVEEPPKFNDDGSPNMDNGEFFDWFAGVIRNEGMDTLQRGPVSDEAVAAASKTMTTAQLEELAKWRPTPGNSVPGPEQVMAAKVLEYRAAQKMQFQIDELSKLDPQNMSDSQLLAYTKEVDNFMTISKLREGIGSEQGRAFRINQLLGQVAGTTPEQAVKDIGEAGRAEMLKKVIEKNGGVEGMKNKLNAIKIIREQAKVGLVPDEAFVSQIRQVARKSKHYGESNALTKVAMNGMLSSPKTWVKAAFANAATTGKTVIDNFVEASIPGSAKTYAEANIHFKTVMTSMWEGFAPAAKAFREGGNVGGATKFEMSGLTASKNAEDVAEKAGGRWAAAKGVATRVLTAEGLPVRVLIGIDTYWQHVNSSAVLASDAVRFAKARGLTGDAFDEAVEFMRKNPTDAMEAKAKLIASTNTMAKELDGFGASIDEMIEAGSDYVPFARVLLPFTKTAMNGVEYAVQNGPLAPLLSQDFKYAMKKGGRMKDEALAKVISGTTATMGLTALAASGYVKGEDSSNEAYKIGRAVKGTETPNGAAVKLPGMDKWVEIPRGMEPITTVVNISALLSKSAGHLPRGEYEEMATAARVMLATAVGPDGLTQGLSDILSLAEPGAQFSTGKFAADVASRFIPLSGAQRALRDQIDPTTRDAMPEGDPNVLKEFYSALKARVSNTVPFYSKDLPAQRNLWGDAIQIPDGLGPDSISPIAVSGEKDLAMKQTFESMTAYYRQNRDKVFGLSRVPVEMPERRMNNPMAKKVPYEFTPQEYSTFVQLNAGVDPETGKALGGPTLRDAVGGIMEKYEVVGKNPADMDPVAYRNMTGELNQTFMMYRERARKMIMLPKYGDVQAKMFQQAQQYMMSAEAVANGGQ